MADTASTGAARGSKLPERPRLLAAAVLVVATALLSPMVLRGVVYGTGAVVHDALGAATVLVGAAAVGAAIWAARTEDLQRGLALAAVAVAFTAFSATLWNGYWWGFDGFMDGFMDGFNMTPPGSPRG